MHCINNRIQRPASWNHEIKNIEIAGFSFLASSRREIATSDGCAGGPAGSPIRSHQANTDWLGTGESGDGSFMSPGQEIPSRPVRLAPPGCRSTSRRWRSCRVVRTKTLRHVINTRWRSGPREPYDRSLTIQGEQDPRSQGIELAWVRVVACRSGDASPNRSALARPSAFT